MSRSARSAFAGAVFITAVALGLHGEATAVPATAQSAQASSSSVWTMGIARFTISGEGGDGGILATTIPRLIIANLQTLPKRRPPRADAIEGELIRASQARFAAGADLAGKLDERSSKFLDPSMSGEEKRYGIKSADKAVREAMKKLTEALKPAAEKPVAEKPADDSPGEEELVVKLWEAHARGSLIDPPGDDIAKAAKVAGVDFLVAGSVSMLDSGYALVTLRGYDATLCRVTLSYTSYCAADDPEPLAKELADRLERFSAGREFARIEARTDPPGSELYLDGRRLPGGSRIAYVYVPGVVRISAASPGYEAASVEMPVELGDRRVAELKLAAISSGKVAIASDPEGAVLSLDSMPIGTAPATIGLDGTRKVLTISAEGQEPQTIVLPAEGESNIDIRLRPADGIGPGGRIAAAKDDFYWAFGWFAASIPVTTLTLGIYNGYDEAYQRSGSPSLEYSRWNASRALAAACAVTATTAVIMVIRLVKYLKTAR